MDENPYDPPKTSSGSLEPPYAARFSPATVAIATGQVATGLVAGFAIWAAVAPREAWDAIPLYSVFVLAAGLLASFARPLGFYWGIIGVYLGQVIAMHVLLPGVGAIVPPFIGVLIFGTVPAAVGAMLGAGIGFYLHLARRRFLPLAK